MKTWEEIVKILKDVRFLVNDPFSKEKIGSHNSNSSELTRSGLWQKLELTRMQLEK